MPAKNPAVDTRQLVDATEKDIKRLWAKLGPFPWFKLLSTAFIVVAVKDDIEKRNAFEEIARKHEEELADRGAQNTAERVVLRLFRGLKTVDEQAAFLEIMVEHITEVSQQQARHYVEGLFAKGGAG